MAVIDLPTLTIASGSQESDALGAKWLEFLDSLTIHAPSALTGTTVNIEVADEDPDGGSPTWRILRQGGSDVTIAADDTLTLEDLSFMGLRINSDTNEGSDRDFELTGKESGLL